MKKYFFLLFYFLPFALSAQVFYVRGTVIDSTDNNAVISASVALTSLHDSNNVRGVITDTSGNFLFPNVPKGIYYLKISYVGYESILRSAKVEDSDINFGTVKMLQNSNTLKDVVVEDKATRVEQKGDTSDYNAKAFKTNPDATAEELVTKMPGITTENGTVKAHGEKVEKVTVDGKDYFGDDATLALKNMPADIVDRVQVYDRMNDQSNFTGFDDGNTQKSMNIVTRNGMNNGLFGKIFAGYGYISDSRYSAGANLNWFTGDRRLSLIGISNNVNQQNFSMQDLLGVTGGGGGGFRGGMPGGSGGRGGGAGRGMNNSTSNFMVGQQNGISTTHSAGLNYADVWGKKKKVKVTGSYFFNFADNINTSLLTRKYFDAGDSSIYYMQNSNTGSRNINHRINFRLEYNIDSVNQLIVTPKFSWQTNNQTNVVDGTNSVSDALLSNTMSNYTSKNYGYNFSSNVVFNHRFNKQYRTFSIDIGNTINNKFNTGSQYALNRYFDVNDSSLIDQRNNADNTSYHINGSFTYTEPGGKNSMFQFSYQPSYIWNKTDKETFNRDTLNEYNAKDSTLSNQYSNNYMTHRAGISYRLKGEKFNLTLGVNGQYALLTGKNVFPLVFEIKKTFWNVLPNAQFNFKFKNSSSLRFNYRTSTNVPSVTQLQSVVDNSNPLQLSTGNSDLKQSYTHFVMLRYALMNTGKGNSFFVFTSFNYLQNYIANATLLAKNDTLINNSVLLRSGSQITYPVNLNGNMSANIFLNYGFPIMKIKCNMNLTGGFNYALTPGFINGAKNLSNTYGLNAGFMLSSNISEKIDFSIGYNGNYNIVLNTLQTNSNSNYFTHNANARFNWLFWKGLVFNTTLQNTLYNGVSDGFNQNIFLWNASLGYKFLKDKLLELKFGVNDILNQNSGVSRTVTETYVEDNKSKVLQRHYLLSLTYTLKFYNKK